MYRRSVGTGPPSVFCTLYIPTSSTLVNLADNVLFYSIPSFTDIFKTVPSYRVMSAPAPDPLVVPVEAVDEEFSPTERTPLLGASKEKRITPLPKVQLAIVCLIRVVEPICFQVIFPFINQMLLEVGAAQSEEEVGYAAGVVESVFSIAQLLTVFHWGALSDRIGRKPVLILVSHAAVNAVLFSS